MIVQISTLVSAGAVLVTTVGSLMGLGAQVIDPSKTVEIKAPKLISKKKKTEAIEDKKDE